MFRILVVDDDRRYLKFIKTLFEINGLIAHVAEGQEEALQLVKDIKFDMLITDYMMPLMDGVELASIIRNEIPGLPIIMITAAPSKNVSALAKEAGIKSVLDKGTPPSELVRFVKEEYMESKFIFETHLPTHSLQEKQSRLTYP